MDGTDIGTSSTLAEDDMEVKPLSSQVLEFDIVIPSVDNAQPNISLEEEAGMDMVPKIGMEFESDDQAYEFYSNYARLTGFTVRNNHLDKSEMNGEVLARRFPCSKESFVQNDKYGANARKRRKERKTGCLAQMVVSRQSNGKYAVIHFEAKHNHEVRAPDEACSVPPEGRLTDAQAAGVDSEDSFRRHSESAFDYNNHLHSRRRREMKEGEEIILLDCLQKRQLEDPSFFYEVQHDIDDYITNIFWADKQMIVDYGQFGDVVCFDTTFRTNKDCQPLVPFVGVNHHKQVVIFGAALLYDDTIGSFEVLFQTFMTAMSGQKPKTILTDQHAAISEAINLVMPETNHRICIWNIYHNALLHLSHAFDGPGSFSRDFSSCIYDHEDKEDFIQAWKVMLDTHNLRKNKWLKGIFDEREKWAIAYGRHTFYADLKNSELINSFNRNLMDHLNPDLDILQTFEHFERMVSDLRCKELEASYDIFEQLPSLLGNVILLKHARDVYTPEVFEVFQREYEKCLNLVVNECGSSGSLFEYKVNIYEHSREHKVTFNPSNDTVVCSCMKFEFDGVLCSHALKVLDQRNIKVVPTQYMLNRWTKDARVGSVRDGHGSIIEEDPMLAAADNFKILCHKAVKMAAVAAESGEAYQHVNIRFDEIMQGLEKISKIKALMDIQVAENSGRFDGDGDVYFRDEPAFPGGSSMSTSDFISTGFTTSPDYLMLQNDVMVSKTSERSSGLDSTSIPPVKMCTVCKATVSSTWRYGPKGPRTLCNACGLRYKKEHIKLWETPIHCSNPKGSTKRRKSSTTNEF